MSVDVMGAPVGGNGIPLNPLLAVLRQLLTDGTLKLDLVPCSDNIGLI